MAIAEYGVRLVDATRAGAARIKDSFRSITASADKSTKALNSFGQNLGGAGGSAVGLASTLLGPLGVVAGVGALTAGLANATGQAMAFGKAMAEVSTHDRYFSQWPMKKKAGRD